MHTDLSARMLRLGLASVLALAIAGSPSTNVATAKADAPAFEFMRVGSPALIDAKQWVLQGTKLADGSCQYHYPSTERQIPENGWVLRSIGINTSNCTKLMEEGSPAQPLQAPVDRAGGESVSGSLPTISGSGAGAQTTATTSTRGAWQMVVWQDPVQLTTSWDRTQINWTYNGSSVLSGNTAGTWWWFTGTFWSLVAYSNIITQRFESDGAFRGQTKATMRNSWFCQPPTTFTYYFHNRVYGHANGTATIAQSSDTINDCVALHVMILTGYN